MRSVFVDIPVKRVQRMGDRMKVDNLFEKVPTIISLRLARIASQNTTKPTKPSVVAALRSRLL